MTATFDGPSGEACVAKREVSNTSLQALTLLNDPTMIEAAEALGKSIAAEKGTPGEKVDRVIRACLSRPANEGEVSVLAKFYGKVNGTEKAKWTAVVRAVMNLDEFVTKE